MKPKIVFMGTPKFSLPTLELLIKEKFNILCVYTQPPKRSKRGQKINSSPVEEFSKKNNIKSRGIIGNMYPTWNGSFRGNFIYWLFIKIKKNNDC